MKRRSYLTATLGGIAGMNLGGATWSGGAFDPTLGYYIINTTDSGEIGQIAPQTEDPRAPKGRPDCSGVLPAAAVTSVSAARWL